MFLPSKRSANWAYIIFGIFILNTFALLFTRSLLNIKLEQKDIISFVIIALVISELSSLGYFGIKAFSTAFIISDIVAIAFLFFVAVSGIGDNWSNMTSIIGFLMIIGMGIVISTVAEGIVWFRNKNKVITL